MIELETPPIKFIELVALFEKTHPAIWWKFDSRYLIGQHNGFFLVSGPAIWYEKEYWNIAEIDFDKMRTHQLTPALKHKDDPISLFQTWTFVLANRYRNQIQSFKTLLGDEDFESKLDKMKLI